MHHSGITRAYSNNLVVVTVSCHDELEVTISSGKVPNDNISECKIVHSDQYVVQIYGLCIPCSISLCNTRPLLNLRINYGIMLKDRGWQGFIRVEPQEFQSCDRSH